MVEIDAPLVPSCQRKLTSRVRSPLLEGNAFFGTPEHRVMVYNYMLKSLKAEI